MEAFSDLSSLAGVLLALVLALGFFLLVAYLTARATYGAHNEFREHMWDATRSAAGDLLGMNKGTWVISNGEGQVIGSQETELRLVGGPGTLIVQDDHAVILERNGQKGRVVGSGRGSLGRYERVGMIVPLGVRTARLQIRNLMTKDQVQIESFDLLVFHRLITEEELNAADGNQSASSTQTSKAEPSVKDATGKREYNATYLKQKVWNTAGQDWSGAVRSISENTTRDVVGRYNLDDIFPLSDTKRKAFRELLLKEIRGIACKAGAYVTQVDFGEICVPQEAVNKLLEKRMARWKIDIARSESAEQRLHENARAYAQKAMIQAISSEMECPDGDRLGALQNMRLIEALEKMAENPGASLVLATELLRLLDHLNPKQPGK